VKKSRFFGSNVSRLYMGFRALCELGLGPVSLYALYQAGLRTGYFRRVTGGRRPVAIGVFHGFLHPPESSVLQSVLGQQGKESLLAEADEIVSGRVRLFGGELVPLVLSMEGMPASAAKRNWTAYAFGDLENVLPGDRSGDVVDVKFLWEPARFGWAITLVRAYRLTGDERYSAAFWSYTERFLDDNPPCLGLHWVSAQEVALRLIAFTFALHGFRGSSHLGEGRAERLAQAIAAHAARIPSTLVYARAQNNNHLLAEAAGLYTAGVVLPDHPSAKKWRRLGWKWFELGLQSQIAADGAYVQHSANYHRLMLQLALWMACLAESRGRQFSDPTREKLAAAASWLLALLDPRSGRVPNLGPNDGAYILPLASCSYSDFRPVLQAAASFFLGERPLSEGLWDEMSLWLPGVKPEDEPRRFSGPKKSGVGFAAHKTPHVLRFPGRDSWAYFRVAQFTSRPGHADQLHLDLWWRGLNLAQDAGAYLYNAPPPWENALTSCQVHNTVIVDGRDQMARAGRFLYLDWAQAEVDLHESLYLEESGCWKRLAASHDGYRHLGVVHQRSVETFQDGRWVIQDALLPVRSNQTGRNGKPEYGRRRDKDRSSIAHSVCVHWLLPDWRFEVEDGLPGNQTAIRVLSPFGWVRLVFSSDHSSTTSGDSPRLQIVRAGEPLVGSGAVSPVWGWISPTYGDKIPALSVRLTVDGSLPLRISSEWLFPDSEGL
jgi:hypothetical protein